MKKSIRTFCALAVLVVFSSSCAIIKPGEIGVKQRLGKLSENTLDQGPHAYNPLFTKVVITSIQTENLELNLNLPSKEGLNVNAGISILYRVQKEKVPQIINNLGTGYEEIIKSVFRSASADICAQFLAKDMHSGMRADIEREIAIKMSENLNPKGIIIEAVLLKTIQLPPGLYGSIENRLEAEQEALRMRFIIEQEQLEAERKIIAAKGTRDAQLILSEGLTNEIIKLKSIDAFIKLSDSPSSKVIITDGQAPFLIGNEMVE
ncbi:MAG: prohibitin family protein [Flavobacteriales bacterium]